MVLCPDGQKFQIKGSSITTVDYPTQNPKLDTKETANSNLKKIKDLLRQYPKFKGKLLAAQSKWEPVLVSAKEPADNSDKQEVQPQKATPTGTDFTTLDGHKFVAVTVSKVEPDGVSIVTDSGVEKLKFTNLPSDIQKKYGYNPEKEKAYQKQQADIATAVRNKAQQTATQQSVWEPYTTAIYTASRDIPTDEDQKKYDLLKLEFEVVKQICQPLLDHGIERETVAHWVYCTKNHRIVNGIPSSLVLVMLGKPETINRYSHGDDQWVYGNGLYIHVANGLVTSWSDIN